MISAGQRYVGDDEQGIADEYIIEVHELYGDGTFRARVHTSTGWEHTTMTEAEIEQGVKSKRLRQVSV
jgi:hypothetical protein